MSGCATHLDETRQMRSYWESGDYKAAALSAAEMAEGAEDSADELVWLLDEGSASRAAGQISQSIKAFDKAYDLVQKFDSEPEINLAAESKALLTNLSYLPYTGYNYDRIMLGTYQALNCMETGDIDGAAVMLKRVENFQRDAERKNAERISYGMKSAARTSGSTVDGKRVYDANRAMSDVRFQNALAGVYGSGASVFKGSRGNYVNPFAYWLDGVYFMALLSRLHTIDSTIWRSCGITKLRSAGVNAQCRRLKNLGLVVIDYLQLMQSAGSGNSWSNESRTQAVSDISRMMKIMAKELNVPVLCLSQLSRANTQRQDKRPQLSDLRESGAIEQDAYVVVALQREGYYNPEYENPNEVELIILKNRRGETGKIYLSWLPEYTSFLPLDKRHEDD